MNLFKTIIGRLRDLVKLEAFPPEACVICGRGPNPTTGVPLRCANGTHAHLSCLLGSSERARWN